MSDCAHTQPEVLELMICVSAPPSGLEVERRDLLKAIELGLKNRCSRGILPRRSLGVLFTLKDRRRLVSPFWKKDYDVYAQPSRA